MKFFKIAILVLVACMMMTVYHVNGRALTQKDFEKDIILYLHSSHVLAQNRLVGIDTTNPKVMPQVKEGRTLVPLRFIAENLGAKVEFNAPKREVTISYDGRIAKVIIDQKKYTIDDEPLEFDVPPQIFENRTLVPLRALCEKVLRKTVFFNKGIIIISDQSKIIEDKIISQLVTELTQSLGTFQLKEPTKEDIRIKIQTTIGDICIRLFPKDAPKAVENFLKLAQDSYYNGIIFHRVFDDFMIQGGDPTGTGMGGKSIFGKPFEDEFSPRLLFLRGALAMANSGPNTNGSQFFIVQKPNLDLDLEMALRQRGVDEERLELYKQHGGTPWLEQRHTVFGQVYEGLDVVDKIAKAPADDAGRPKEAIKIVSLQMIQ